MKRLIAFALGLALGAAAHAHTPLKTSVPAADVSVPAPKSIELTFGGDVRLTSLTLTDSAGAAKHTDAVPTEIASTFSLSIHQPLEPAPRIDIVRAQLDGHGIHFGQCLARLQARSSQISTSTASPLTRTL